MLLSAVEKPEQIKTVRKLKTCRPGKEGDFKQVLEWLADFWRCLISIFRHLYSGVCSVSNVFITTDFFFPLAFLFFSFLWILQSWWFIKHNPGSLLQDTEHLWWDPRHSAGSGPHSYRALKCKGGAMHISTIERHKLQNSAVILCGPCQFFLTIWHF